MRKPRRLERLENCLNINFVFVRFLSTITLTGKRMLLSLVLLCFAYTSQAQALKATGGTGLYKDRIWWMNFSGISLAAGASDSRDFAIGNGTIHVTIDQVAFSGNISVSPYTDLSAVRLIGYNSYYSNAGLDQLYNIGGSESNNTLYYALSNNLNGGTSNSAPNNLPLIVTFRIRAYATYPSGVTTPLSLVFGSAETDDNSSAGYEYTQCTTNGSTWQLLEKANQDAAQIQKLSFSNNNLTARMMMGGYGSTGSVPNPANVALVYTTKSAATAASPLTVNSQFMSGGKSAIAIGFIVDQDGGDAVASYDNAVHIFQPLVSGGNPSQTSGTFDNFLSSTGAMGGTPVISAGALTTPTDLYLGSVAPDNDATIFHSAANNQDEITGINDEDAILSPVYMTSCLTNYSIANIPVHNSLTAPATLIAWIDFNGDGVFSASEASTVQTIAVGQTVASLNWNGVTSAPSGTRPIRLRITSDVMTASDAASTVNTGEVEDHTVIFSDVTIPTVSISPVSIVGNSTSSCGLSVATNNPTFNDDCGVVKLTWNMTGATTGSSLATGINYLGEQVFNVGLTTVTYTASDADGNSASCSFTVTITDNIAPTITTCAVARTVSGCSTADITSPVYSSTLATSTYAEFSSLPNNGVASDNCLIGTVQYQDVASGTCPTTVTRTWHILDASGNESTCSQLITIQDLVKPTASNPSDIVVSIANDPIPAPDISVVTDETDNCSAPTVTWLSDAAPTFSGCTETTVRTYKVTDACGNSISVVQNIIRSITTAAPLISAVTQPTCAVSTGSFTIDNYNASYTYTFTPSAGVINTNGSVVAPAGTYTITAVSGACTSSATIVTVSAQPTGSFCSDTDGDGKQDNIDLDDDNDGILDTDENSCLTPIIAGYSGTFFEPKPSDFGKNFTGTPQLGLNLSLDLSAQFGYAAGSGMVIINVTNANIHPTADAFFTRGDLPVTDWEITGTVKSIVGIEQGLEYFAYQRREIRLYTNEAQITNLSTITPGNWATGLEGNVYYQFNNSATEYKESTGNLGAYLFTALLDYNDKKFGLYTNDTGLARWSTYFVRIRPECDADMDGIPNRLDLDSDADLCPDANEYYGSTSAVGTDGNNYYGNGNPPATNTDGKVTAAGYTGTYAPAENAIDITVSTPVANVEVCEGDDAVFSVTAAALKTLTFSPLTTSDVTSELTYQWQVSADGGTTFTNISGSTSSALTLVNVTTSMNNYQYKVIIMHPYNICSEESVGILTINPSPTVPTLSAVTQPTCDVSTGSFTIDNYDAGYTYTVTPSTGVTVSGNTITAPAGTYTVTATLGTCTSVASASVTVNAQPATPTQPLLSAVTQPTCAVSTGSFTITNYDAANTYTFSPAEGVVNTAGSVVVSAGTYTVTATSGTCTSVASASVTIDAQPLTPIVPILSAVTQPTCSVATGSFTIINYDASFTYAVIPATGVTLSGNSITAPAGTYQVTATLGACTSMASSNATVYAQPSTPTATIGSVSSLCTNSTPTQLTGTPTGGLFSGTGVNIGGLFSPVVAGVGNHTITYTYTNQYGCSAVATTSVQVIAAPGLSVTPATQTICSGSQATVSVSGDNGGTVNWTSNLLGLTGTGTTFNTGALFNKGTSPLTIILNASVTAGSCIDNTSTSVTVNPEPRVLVVPTSAVVCFYEIPHFTLNSVLTGTTINWQLINNVDSSIVNSGSGTDNITLFSSPIPAGSYTLKVTGSKDGCTGAITNAQLIVN